MNNQRDPVADSFTIRIFVPDGDPEGVRVIDKMNWTGRGLVFPRSKWMEVRTRKEMKQIGVYILAGYEDLDDDLLTIYIGQADGIQDRIETHYKDKDFWDRGIVFVSTGDGLNRAHVTWLEYALVNHAKKADRCLLNNGNVPQEPALSEAEKADTSAFLKEILQILPLAGLRVFEIPKAVTVPQVTDLGAIAPSKASDLDVVIVPAQKEGFDKVFLGEDCWYAIRLSGGMMNKIKYIAAYQTNPVSAITHFAPVSRIEPYGDEGKYKVVFSEKAKEIGPIKYGGAPSGAMRNTRYTTFSKLKAAKSLSDI